jgi:transposase
MTRWTTPTLAEHLRRESGTDVHPETVRVALARLGFSWKRPRRQLPKDPDYEQRMADLEQAIDEAEPETSVLFEDETELRRFPPLRSAWMPRGEQRAVKVPDGNDKFALYGALDISTGHVVTEAHPKGRSDYTKSFLEKLLSRVEGNVLLLWDRASWHTSKTVEAWIAKHDRLEVLLLPKRAPEDNPVENLWRGLKNVIAANLERELEALKNACRQFFDALSPKQALRTAGLAH